MRGRRTGTGPAAGLLIVLLLAGCTSSADPGASPSPQEAPPSPSPSATASASAAPSVAAAPTLPTEAEGRSRAAAKAFVRHYIDLVNHAVSTGELAALKAAGRRGCESCRAVLQRVRSVYSAGGHIRSEGWKIRTIRVVSAGDTSPTIIDVGIRLTPQTVVRSNDGATEEFEGGQLPATFFLVRSEGGWLVRDWERAA